MAIIKNGILGGVSGKVGGVIGFNWKGIDVLRGYAKPANPRTAAQTTQRNKFTAVVEFAKTIKSGVIDIYWNDLFARMSGFNGFMKKNIALADGTTGITPNNLITVGSLESVSTISASYDGNNVTIAWQNNIMGNGKLTDDVVCVIWDNENKIAFVSDEDAQRTDEELTINVGTGRTASSLIVFLAFHRAGNTQELVSQSVGATVTAS